MNKYILKRDEDKYKVIYSTGRQMITQNNLDNNLI